MDILLITVLSLLFFTILFLLISAYFILMNLIPIMFYGAFFAGSAQKLIEKITFLADVKEGQKAVDLGSGDGRLVIALAKAGAKAHGYEINPLLVWWSRHNIRKAGLSDRAFVHWKNFWQEDFSGFDVVVFYQISYIMKKLEAKLKKELKTGSRVVSNYFIFPDWQYLKKEDNIYLYVK